MRLAVFAVAAGLFLVCLSWLPHSHLLGGDPWTPKSILLLGSEGMEPMTKIQLKVRQDMDSDKDTPAG